MQLHVQFLKLVYYLSLSTLLDEKLLCWRDIGVLLLYALNDELREEVEERVEY